MERVIRSCPLARNGSSLRFVTLSGSQRSILRFSAPSFSSVEHVMWPFDLLLSPGGRRVTPRWRQCLPRCEVVVDFPSLAVVSSYSRSGGRVGYTRIWSHTSCNGPRFGNELGSCFPHALDIASRRCPPTRGKGVSHMVPRLRSCRAGALALIWPLCRNAPTSPALEELTVSLGPLSTLYLGFAL